jgi:hypothetical protein
MKTGFNHGWNNVMKSKQYTYHGVQKTCNIQPEPGSFIQFPLGPPFGPPIFAFFVSFQANGLTTQGRDYDIIHNQANADNFNNELGQRYWPTYRTYYIRRWQCVFDTSAIPDNAVIIDATLDINPNSDASDRDFVIVIRSGMPSWPAVPITYSSYNLANYSGNLGSIDTSSGNYYSFNLNASGLLAINKTGNTKFMLMSDNDIGSVRPIGYELVSYAPFQNAGLLQLHYQIPL